MKKTSFLLSCFLSAALAGGATAATVSGFVVCDANQNQVADTGDLGIPGVLIVVTNQNGTFSNSVVTAADGSFSLQIPNFDPLAERRDPLSQVYVETLSSGTLQAGSTILLPTAISYLSPTPAYYIDFAADLINVVYTSGTGNSNTGNWLINNPDCQMNNCRLTGGGMVRAGHGKKAAHTFGGMIFSESPGTLAPGGKWSDVGHDEKMEFHSTLIQAAHCGEIQKLYGTNLVWLKTMEFEGRGILKWHGDEGKKKHNRYAHGAMVFFTAYVEDHGQPRQGHGQDSDRYYLRVYNANGDTLMLVSADPSNPADLAPAPVSEGDLRIQ